MQLNTDNEIDKLFAKTYSKTVINEINPEKIGFLGMNLNIEHPENIKLKLYCNPDYSNEIAEKRKIDAENEPFIKFLQDLNIRYVLEIVNENKKRNVYRYNTFLYDITKEDFEKIIDYFSKSSDRFDINGDEIRSISLLKQESEKLPFNPPACIGFIKNKQDINVLKIYWFYEKFDRNTEYISCCNIEKLNYLNEVIKKILNRYNDTFNRLHMLCVEYNKDKSENHKIYVNTKCNPDPYSGITDVFAGNDKFKEKINIIKKWHDIHNEFRCHGFAISQNDKDEYILNIYFSYTPEVKRKFKSK